MSESIVLLSRLYEMGEMEREDRIQANRRLCSIRLLTMLASRFLGLDGRGLIEET